MAHRPRVRGAERRARSRRRCDRSREALALCHPGNGRSRSTPARRTLCGECANARGARRAREDGGDEQPARDTNSDDPGPPPVSAARPALHSLGPADVAQLVEHFTRNEGVPGSSPGVGFALALGLRNERGPFRASIRLWVRFGSDSGSDGDASGRSPDTSWIAYDLFSLLMDASRAFRSTFLRRLRRSKRILSCVAPCARLPSPLPQLDAKTCEQDGLRDRKQGRRPSRFVRPIEGNAPDKSD